MMNPEDFSPEDEQEQEEQDELDLGEVPEDTGKREFKLVAKGPQRLYILDSEQTVYNAGNKQLEVTFADENNVKFKEWFSLLPTAIWRISALVMAIDPEVKPGSKLKWVKSKYIGRRFKGTVKHEKNGQYTNCKVTKFEPDPEGPIGEDLPF